MLYSNQGYNSMGHKSHKSVYGTEQDPHNCSFFLRTAACRHGENCPKAHPWPAFSNTVLFKHLWIPPKHVSAKKRKLAAHYADFLEDLFQECKKYGEVLDIQTLSNNGDHMLGNTFVKFSDEEEAQTCISLTNGRFYAGRKVATKFSPLTDFDHARCRDFVLDGCKRGKYCNFAHFMEHPDWVYNYLNEKNTQQRHSQRKKRTKREKSKSSRDAYPEFPIGGSAHDRRSCILIWNQMKEKEGDKNSDAQDSGSSQSEEAKISVLKLYKPNF